MAAVNRQFTVVVIDKAKFSELVHAAVFHTQAGRIPSGFSELQIAGTGKRQGSGNDFRALRPHVSTIVDNQADPDRDIFVDKIFSLLMDSAHKPESLLCRVPKRGFGIDSIRAGPAPAHPNLPI